MRDGKDWRIDTFFSPPEYRPHPQEQQVGTLYLLRQELLETAFDVRDQIPPESDFCGKEVKRRFFATAMLTFAGIDLLAKFAKGSDKGKLHKRFKAFCRVYLSLSKTQANRVWAVRNAMMHSFGLHTDDGHAVMVSVLELDHVVDDVEGRFYKLSVSSLYWRFIDAVNKYEEAVRTDAAARENFEQMFSEYGTVFMVPVSR